MGVQDEVVLGIDDGMNLVLRVFFEVIDDLVLHFGEVSLPARDIMRQFIRMNAILFIH
jgi:small nuclear ribonucleoprotein (snRNP)-like protein